MTPRDSIHRDTRRQRLRHNPGLHLIRPLPVPTAATANRENLQCSLHGENHVKSIPTITKVQRTDQDESRKVGGRKRLRSMAMQDTTG